MIFRNKKNNNTKSKETEMKNIKCSSAYKEGNPCVVCQYFNSLFLSLCRKQIPFLKICSPIFSYFKLPHWNLFFKAFQAPGYFI